MFFCATLSPRALVSKKYEIAFFATKALKAQRITKFNIFAISNLLVPTILIAEYKNYNP
jgi:hypothetical protein